ncbi:MAG TPA: hypothetical protein VI306_24575 [Pyrinomonadaceae bacterium]
MRDDVVSDALLREFLLGTVSEEDQERIEDLFLTVDEVRDRVHIAEQDLIEDYLEGSLNPTDRSLFLSRYGETPEQRERLEINKSLKNFAVEQSVENNVVKQSSTWNRIRSKQVLTITIAVAAALLIVVSVVVLKNRRQQQATEFELAQLNTPAALKETPPHLVSIELRPVSVRNAEQLPELKLRSDMLLVDLQLPWIQKEQYPRYEIQFLRLRDKASFTIHNLTEQQNVHVRLPTSLLSVGQYQINLTGVNDDGTRSPTEEYSFVVSN